MSTSTPSRSPVTPRGSAQGASGRSKARRGLPLGIAGLFVALLAGAQAIVPGRPAAASIPIKHVIILFQENHSFDDVLGRFCSDVAHGTIVRAGRNDKCDGAIKGKLHNGKTIKLAAAPDYVPDVSHTVQAQETAIDGGAMDGFSLENGCTRKDGYACYQTFDPSSIPNLTSLAEQYALSDRTFELRSTPSWGGHLVLAAATTDGFSGDNPKVSKFTTQRGPGWGCDSYRDAPWWDGSEYVPEPSCIPNADGQGPYRPSPVSYVPTIFDRLDAAGLTWKLYATGPSGTSDEIPYGWDICPSFFECLGSSQRDNLVDTTNVISDAAAGTLPNFAIVTPALDISQHNEYSMAEGDNWIGDVVSAVGDGPDWDSTAIFIVWDDCGCFYDHVNPLKYNPNWGIRLPVVIVSPYARAGYTDSAAATLVSFLAYTEHVYSLPPLGTADAAAYAYSRAFDYNQKPLPPPGAAVQTQIPKRERERIAREPPPLDDPT